MSTSPDSLDLPDDVLVSVRGLSKKFCRNLRRSMVYGIQDLARNFVGRPVAREGLRPHEFWALKNLSLELRRGDSLGLLGHNGSGKTTLLRVIAGIFPPDQGQVVLRGRVGALIALGAGFHPHMSGRENIFLYGAILGMSRSEIGAKYDEIVAFGDISDFIDAPVNSYSSGMRARLGFAVAVHTDPDILLVDEVLAVGDMAFRAKCYRKIQELMKREIAVVFVSHSMDLVQRICNRALHMRHGEILFEGGCTEAISHYECEVGEPVGLGQGRRLESGEAQIESVTMERVDGSRPEAFLVGDAVRLEFSFRVRDALIRPNFLVGIINAEGQHCVWMNSQNQGFRIEQVNGRARVCIEIDELALVPGVYWVEVEIFDEAFVVPLVISDHQCRFEIRSELRISGVFSPRHRWSRVE